MPSKPQRDKFAPLTDYERELAQRLAANPGEWLNDLMPAIVSKLEVNQPRFIATDLSGIKGEEWREVGATGQPAFAGTPAVWENFGGTHETAAFYKDALGIVHLKGLIKTGTVTTTAFTLPEGYRPKLDLRFAVFSNAAFGALAITSAGAVIPNTGNNASFGLNVSFRAA